MCKIAVHSRIAAGFRRILPPSGEIFRRKNQRKGGAAMLKGVSQKVIEVVHTDNRYFERAILFLKPGIPEEDRPTLRRRAGEYLTQIDLCPRRRERRLPALADGVKLLLAALGGAGLACLFLLL